MSTVWIAIISILVIIVLLVGLFFFIRSKSTFYSEYRRGKKTRKKMIQLQKERHQEQLEMDSKDAHLHSK